MRRVARRFRSVVLALAGALCAVGCANATMRGAAAPPAGTPVPHARQPVRVGAASADITPPPGPSMFGHGPDSLASSGYWTRLQCRAFVFETAPENRHALVSCDLGAISLYLQRAVAARLADVVHVSRLMLTATHTHAGPAHFFESPAYAGVLSSRVPGFDQKMVDFLADRIAGAVRGAASQVVPAKLRWVSGPVWGLNRNRSPEPFRANRPAFEAPYPADPALPSNQRQVDPRLDVLQIEDMSGAPLATLGFFAMHPTVLPAHTRFFGGDTHAVATRLLERDLLQAARQRGSARVPVVAIVNTNEGDMWPTWMEGTASETVRIGRRLAFEIARLSAAPAAFTSEIALDSRYVEVDLAGAEYSNGHLCRRAVLGQASGRGAADHRSFTEGLVDEASDYSEAPVRDDVLECHRPKAPLLGPLQPVLASTQGFPERVPLALQRIGDRLLAYAPAELTVTAGQRLRKTVERNFGPVSRDHALVVGLSNAYMQYVTTPEEYQLQYYEGGSNLYGPQTLDYLDENFAWLAVALRGADVPPYLKLGRASEFQYEPPPERERFPVPEGKTLEELGTKRRARFVCRAEVFDPPAICFEWTDGAPGRVPLSRAPWLKLLSRGAPIQSCWERIIAPLGTTCESALPVDDRNFEFFTWSEGRLHDYWLWATLYRPSKAQWEKLVSLPELEFRAGDVSSGKFSATELPLCEGRTLRRCMKGSL
jgi:neutral ceramidase